MFCLRPAPRPGVEPAPRLFRWRVETDHDGRYRVSALPPALVWAQVRKAQGVWRTHAFDPVQATDPPARFDIDAPRSAVLRVQRGAGSGRAPAWIGISGAETRPPRRVDEGGQVRFVDLRPGRYEIRVTYWRDGAETAPWLRRLRLPVTADQRRVVSLEAGEEREVVLSEPSPPAASLEVQVRDPAGRPVRGCEVWLERPGATASGRRARLPGESDRDGRVAFVDLQPGRWRVRLPGTRVLQDVSLRSGTHREIVLEALRSPVYEIEISATDGERIEGARVVVAWGDPERDAPAPGAIVVTRREERRNGKAAARLHDTMRWQGARRSARTDGDGLALLPSIPVGAVRVYVRAQGYLPWFGERMHDGRRHAIVLQRRDARGQLHVYGRIASSGSEGRRIMARLSAGWFIDASAVVREGRFELRFHGVPTDSAATLTLSWPADPNAPERRDGRYEVGVAACQRVIDVELP